MKAAPCIKKYMFFLLPTFFCSLAFAQADWSLKSKKNGISVYTKTVSASGLKGIRVKCSIPAKLSQMVALIMDVNAGKDWVYGTKSSVLLKRVSPSELYYYSEVDIPFPLSNRDFISHLTVTQDPKTKVVTINGPTEAGYLAAKPNIVRVSRSYGKWILAVGKQNTIDIDYYLEVDPGGELPTWLVNLFAASGPTETFKKMKRQIQKPRYVNANLGFIDNG